MLLKKQKKYEQTIESLRAKLEVQPGSSKILEQLKVALEGLHFTERYLALFASDTLLGDRFQQEWLFVKATSTFASQGGFWTVLRDSAFRTLFGAPEEEDFTEEMRILSLYDDCPPVAPLMQTFPKQIRPQVQQHSSGLQQLSLQASPDERSRKYSSAALEQNSTEEYINPLYNHSPTVPVRSTRKTVSFSPVNEIFEGSDQHPSNASNDFNA
eukprot:c3232_g1_i1 orf=95-733(+)